MLKSLKSVNRDAPRPSLRLSSPQYAILDTGTHIYARYTTDYIALITTKRTIKKVFEMGKLAKS